MIKIIDGDLMKATEDIIGHQVNTSTMGSGVALQIKKYFPKAYNQHSDLCHKIKRNNLESKDLLGTVQVVICNEKIICNIFGQDKYGYDGALYTDVEKLKKGLLYVHKMAKEKEMSVALPYNIGCCRGGADWGGVYKILEKIFNDEVQLTLYRLDKDTNVKYFK